MSGESQIAERALAAQDRLREHLRKLAAATDEVFPAELEAVREALDEYDSLLSDDRGKALPWPEDARERIARCRVELKQLQAGYVRRKDAIGIVRLVIPRFDKDGER
jgi:hypothetical protein